MALIFHQNMKVYGGAAAWRNTNFDVSLAAINAATGPVYVAAGFTEVMNAGASVAALAARAIVLDPGLTRLGVIETGITVGGRREWVGIAWDPGAINVQHVGSVLWSATNREWEHFTMATPGTATFVVDWPDDDGLAADSRGIGYIAGVNGGLNFIIGFLHEMHNLRTRGLLLAALSTSVQKIQAGLGGGYAAARAIIGGDFNVEAETRTYLRPVPVDIAAASTGPGVFTNTTAAHAYDWWGGDVADGLRARQLRGPGLDDEQPRGDGPSSQRRGRDPPFRSRRDHHRDLSACQPTAH